MPLPACRSLRRPARSLQLAKPLPSARSLPPGDRQL